MQKISIFVFFFMFLVGLLAVVSLATRAYADSNQSYVCYTNGGAAGQGDKGNKFVTTDCNNGVGACDDFSCSASQLCDDNYSDSAGKPCVEFNQIQCKCTGATTFSCGKNSTDEFSRSCGSGQVCDMSVFKAGSKWPCSTNATTTNTPTGTFYNPCPNNICDTSLGPISVKDPSAFVAKLFQILLGISGAVALILIIVAGYQLMISQGNPEKVKAARERLTSAIIGLLFIIFSVAILQVIGVDILHIPGFTK
jgi:hypothetical protein